MLVIPAIDIKDSKCVRLTQGRMDAVTVYSDDPASVAVKWEAAGAKLIHVVDLDGAVQGAAVSYNVVRKIADSVKAEIQVGGGIRDAASVRKYLSIPNVKRVILGTAACLDPEMLAAVAGEFKGRVAAGIDAKDGYVAIKGWMTVTEETATDLAARLAASGVAAIIYTDISRDGMLIGPNVAATKSLALSSRIPVIASGGISTLADVESYRGAPIEGMIIGKALYSGNIDLREAIEAANRKG